jgi:hypothetical protein
VQLVDKVGAPSRDERSRRRRDAHVDSRKYPGRFPGQVHKPFGIPFEPVVLKIFWYRTPTMILAKKNPPSSLMTAEPFGRTPTFGI